MHGYTGAIDLINKELIAILKNKGNNSLHINIDQERLEPLLKRGYVTNMSISEERQYVKNIAETLHKNNTLVKAFVITVTYNCNFRCPYCYENDFSKHGSNWSKNTLTKEMVDRIYNVMLELEPDRTKHNNIITLYGGEPLLKENYNIVKYIVEKGIMNNYCFVAITNGYEIDNYIDLLGKGKIESLQITIDGMEETHNKRRKHFKNNDSFSKIVNNIKKIIETGVTVGIRINTDKSNINEIPELMKFFKNSGFLDDRNINISSSYTNGCTYNDTQDVDLKKINFVEKITNLKETGGLHKISIANFTDMERALNKSIKENQVLAFKSEYCGAHNGMIVFDPIGNIYPCWEAFGSENNIIGKYKNKLTVTDAYDKWQNRIVTNIENCKNCKYALFCGGGCAGKLILSNKDIYSSNCEDYQQIFNQFANYYYKKELKVKFSNPVKTQEET